MAWHFWMAPPLDGRGYFLPSIHIRADVYNEDEDGLAVWMGCLDAPTHMPAGGCFRKAHVGEPFFARQLRFMRSE